jgi:hypothetical protein
MPAIRFFVDRDAGLLGQFRHQYFLLFLIPHIHKATLLMLSDRMVDALNRLEISDADSVRRFKRTIRQLLEIFLRFTHRYWFHEVSDQPQAKELFKMTEKYLGTDALFEEIRNEIEDMSNYLETDTLRRQANTVVRLTVVTAFGLVRHRRHRLPRHEPVCVVRAVNVGEIRGLHRRPGSGHRAYAVHDREVETPVDFLEAVSDERLPVRAKIASFLDVWRHDSRTAETGADGETKSRFRLPRRLRRP